jgi:copper(I)-binding protein
MTKLVRHAAVVALFGLAALSGVDAQEIKAGDLTLERPWSRATPSGSKVGAGYVTITNKGAAADRLVSATAAVAGRVEIHEMTVKDGVMVMRALPSGLAIDGGKKVSLEPGGYHIMFMELKAPLKQGDKVPVTLQFEKAGKVDVSFDVQAVGAQRPASGHGH